MEDTNKNELKALKLKADMLGVTYSPNIGVDKLREKINEKMDSVNSGINESPSIIQEKLDTTKRALKLCRVIVRNNNPRDQHKQGVTITAANGAMKYRKFVLFNHPYHIPQIILNYLKEQKYITYVVKKVSTPLGTMDTKEPVERPLYTIEELPPISEQEFKHIKQRQSAMSEE